MIILRIILPLLFFACAAVYRGPWPVFFRVFYILAALFYGADLVQRVRRNHKTSPQKGPTPDDNDHNTAN